jgi:tripeptidyl-peptidase-1
LYAVSTPGSALYGQHLTLEEAKAFMEPTAESLSAVTEWLDANGLTATVTSPYGEWVRLLLLPPFNFSIEPFLF